MLPARPGFNEQPCSGSLRTHQGDSSVLGGCKDRQGHGQSRNTERERGLQLSVGSLAHRQPLCCSPEIWNRQGPRVSSGWDLLGHRAPTLLLQPWHPQASPGSVAAPGERSPGSHGSPGQGHRSQPLGQSLSCSFYNLEKGDVGKGDGEAIAGCSPEPGALIRPKEPCHL